MRLLVATVFLSGAAGVVAASWGSHQLSGEARETWLLGVQFLFFHLLAALAGLGLFAGLKGWIRTGWLLVAGGVSFALSLWLGIVAPDLPLGFLAPLGGMLMIAGWLSGAVVALRPKG